MKKEDLTYKWLNDELTQDELTNFKALEDYDLNVKIVDNAKNFKTSHFYTTESFDTFKSKLNKVTEVKKETPVFKLNSYKNLYRIAAMLVIGLGLYFTMFNNSLESVQTLASQQTSFELPDESSVVLNAASKAIYSSKRWSKNRQINLEGEAYFKVAKGSKFDVVTQDGIVSVLGTQFTVKSRGSYFEVECYEGIVSVKMKDKEERLTQGKTLKILNGNLTLNTTYISEPEWLKNMSSFNSVPLEEVIKELERQYGIVIKTYDDIDINRMFTGGFVHNNLDDALLSICVPLELAYKKDSTNTILLSRKSE